MIYTLIRKDTNNNVDAVLSFDAVTAYDESWSSTVTTQTVEYGFDITDNINIEPPTYSIDAIISSYSLFNLDKEIVWDGEGFSNPQSSDEDKIHIKAREELLKIFTDRSILTLVESTVNSSEPDYEQRYEGLKASHFKEIDNCVMTSLSISSPDKGGEAFYVSIKLQKIFVAMVTTTELSESEMNPALTGLLVNNTNVASKTSSSDESGTEDGSNVAQATTDSGVPSEAKTTTGLSQAEGQAYRLRELKPIQSQIEAEKKLLEVQKSTGQNWMIIKRSDGYYLEPTG